MAYILQVTRKLDGYVEQAGGGIYFDFVYSGFKDLVRFFNKKFPYERLQDRDNWTFSNDYVEVRILIHPDDSWKRLAPWDRKSWNKRRLCGQIV